MTIHDATETLVDLVRLMPKDDLTYQERYAFNLLDEYLDMCRTGERTPLTSIIGGKKERVRG